MNSLQLQERPRVRVKTTIPSVQPVVKVHRRLAQFGQNKRFQHELKEMKETEDLGKIDDDVEAAATLLEWQAPEHTHHDHSPRWFIALAATITATAGLFLFLANFMAAITIAFAGGLIYYLAQRQPATIRYRLMIDGIAVNNTLYHYRHQQGFNIIYQPGEVTCVIIRGKARFAPLLHLPTGETDPGAIRDILIQFMPEHPDMQEPFVDVWARRLKI